MPYIWADGDDAGSSESVSTVSTNRTDDGLVGAGRTLGLVYDFLGLRIEDAINKIAEKRGMGPNNVFRRIEGLLEDAEDRRCRDRRWRDCYHSRLSQELEFWLEKDAVVRECQQLMAYARSVLLATPNDMTANQ